jgi:hypothetical protein
MLTIDTDGHVLYNKYLTRSPTLISQSDVAARTHGSQR